jgi:hypothetical protein
MAELIAFVCAWCGRHSVAPVEPGAAPGQTGGCVCATCLEALVAPGGPNLPPA